jgi:hypothetical protein
MKRWITATVVIALLAACDAATGPGEKGNVAVRFGTTTNSALASNILSTDDHHPTLDQLTVSGTNGSIVIDDIRFIVEEMELRSSESNSACENDDENEVDDDIRTSQGSDQGRDDDEADDECEFEGGPFIVDLPLGGATTIATQDVPAGTYDSFRFKMDDLEGDDDDEADDRANAPNLLADMRAVYPNFPSKASMVVKGTQNGQPFVVYLRSKLRVSQPISPPLVVPGNQALTVQIDPTAWFKIGNQVMNLAALNGQLVNWGQFNSGMRGAHRDDD